MTLSPPVPHTTLYADVAVIFIDIAGFVARTYTLSDQQRVALLHDIYTVFDATAKQYHAQIIKYLGDGCLLVCGPDFAHTPLRHPKPRTEARPEALSKAQSRNNSLNQAIALSLALQQRLPYPTKYAITCGDVMGGYIGINQSQFDIWGNIVDRCARIVGTTPSNAIYVCHNTAQLHALPNRVSKHHLQLKDFGNTCVYQIH